MVGHAPIDAKDDSQLRLANGLQSTLSRAGSASSSERVKVVSATAMSRASEGEGSVRSSSRWRRSIATRADVAGPSVVVNSNSGESSHQATIPTPILWAGRMSGPRAVQSVASAALSRCYVPPNRRPVSSPGQDEGRGETYCAAAPELGWRPGAEVVRVDPHGRTRSPTEAAVSTMSRGAVR